MGLGGWPVLGSTQCSGHVHHDTIFGDGWTWGIQSEFEFNAVQPNHCFSPDLPQFKNDLGFELQQHQNSSTAPNSKQLVDFL